MRATVTELPDEPTAFEASLEALRDHLEADGSDLVVLPEMPAAPWFCAGAEADDAIWAEAEARHDDLVTHLGELGVPVVLATRPRTLGGHRVNEAFVWTPEDGATGFRQKVHLPDEAGWHEARWYEPGDGSLSLADAAGLRVGFLPCSDVMFPEDARALGRLGAHVVAVPRASAGAPRWEVALRMAAVVSGAYVLSSNRAPGPSGRIPWGGAGFAVDPDGVVLARTSATSPFATVDLDPAVADQAKTTYPRYLR